MRYNDEHQSGAFAAAVPAEPAHSRAPPLMDVLELGVCLLDGDCRALYGNPAAAALMGMSGARALDGHDMAPFLGGRQATLQEVLTEADENGCWEGVLHSGNHPLKARLAARGPGIAGLPTGARYVLSLTDHAEQARLQRELAAAQARAEKSEQARSRFLSHMTHEMRTPLNAIAGFAQLLETGDNLDAEQRENLREISEASTKLLSLIDEVLTRTRGESGSASLNVDQVDLAGLVGECLSLVRHLAHNKQVELIHRPGGHVIRTDRGRLKQVLLNLLSNAIKYNREGGQVVVQDLRIREGVIRIEVQDSGIGIPGEHMECVFSPFQENGGEAPERRSGIGLMITRHLVTLLHGQIDVVSEAQCGSLFWVDLPLALERRSRDRNPPPQPAEAARPPREVLCLNCAPALMARLQRLQAMGRPLRLHQSGAPEDAGDLRPDLILLSLQRDPAPLMAALAASPSLKDCPVAAVNEGNAAFNPDTGPGGFAACIDSSMNFIEFTRVIDRLTLGEGKD